MINGLDRDAFSHAGMAPPPTLAGMGEDPAPVARFSTGGLGRGLLLGRLGRIGHGAPALVRPALPQEGQDHAAELPRHGGEGDVVVLAPALREVLVVFAEVGVVHPRAVGGGHQRVPEVGAAALGHVLARLPVELAGLRPGRVHAGEGEELPGRLEAVRVSDLGGDLGRAHRPYAGHGLQYGPDLGVEQLRNLRVKRLDLVVQEPALYARSLDAARMPTTGEKARMASERRERLLGFFSEHPTSTMVDASIFLGVARSTISRDVAELRASGRLAHEGPTKGGRWVVA